MRCARCKFEPSPVAKVATCLIVCALLVCGSGLCAKRAYADLVGGGDALASSLLPEKDIEYTVVFDANGAQGSMADWRTVVVAGTRTDSQLPLCAYHRDGCRFMGWRTVIPEFDDGSETFVKEIRIPDGQAMVNLNWKTHDYDDAGFCGLVGLDSYADSDRTIRLVACWEDAGTGDVYDGAPPSEGSGPRKVSSTSGELTLKLYKYGGTWAYLSTGSGPSGFSLADGNFAKVPRSSSTPVYCSQNPNLSYCYVFTTNVAEYNGIPWTKRGRAFYSDDGKGVPIYRFFHSGTGYHTYAKVSAISGLISEGPNMYGLKWYNVAFGANGGQGQMSSQRYQYGISYNLPKNAFSRLGYTFAGWAGSNGGSYSDGQSCSNLTSAANGTVTLSARWKAIRYSVEFDPGGGSGSMPDQGLGYDAASPLVPCSFTKPGFEFAGWNTREDGTGEAFADQAEVLNLSATEGERVTLYAQWEPIQLTFSVPSVLELSLTADGKLDGPTTGSAFLANSSIAALAVDDVVAKPSDGLVLEKEPSRASEYDIELEVAEKGVIDLADFKEGLPEGERTGLGWLVPSASDLRMGKMTGRCAGLDLVTPDDPVEIGVLEWKISLPDVEVSYVAADGSAIGSQRVNAGLGFPAPSSGLGSASCWNTAPDGSGAKYLPGDEMRFTSSVTLYARA